MDSSTIAWHDTPAADYGAMPPGTAGVWAWVPAGVIRDDLAAGWRLFAVRRWPGPVLTAAWDDASPAQLEAIAAEVPGERVERLAAMHSRWVIPGDADNSGQAVPVLAVIRAASVEDAA